MAAPDVRPQEACPKCNSKRTAVMGTTSTNPPLQLMRCAACGHIFTGRGSPAGA